MTWLSWEYMFCKLELRMANKCSDGEVTEEHYESYADRLQSLDLDQMREEYNEYFAFGEMDELDELL